MQTRLVLALALASALSCAQAELIKMASMGNVAGVQDALNSGDEIDGVDSGGNTALMWAAWNGHDKVVTSLIAAGADIHAHDGHANNQPVGDTALTKVAFNGKSPGHKRVAEALLAAGAKVDTKNGYGTTALMNAAMKGHADIVALLLSPAGRANVHTRDQGGVTALHKAAWQGHMDIIETLISAGADVNVKRDDGIPPIVLAESNMKGKTVELLKKHGAVMPEREMSNEMPEARKRSNEL